MHDISTQVLRVNPVPSRDGQSIRYVASLSGGQAADGTTYPAEDYVTFDAGLGTKAQGLQGQPTDARVEIVQKPKKNGGFFTNFVLHDIAPQGMLPPMAMPAAGGTPAQPVPAAAAAPAAAPATAPTPHMHPLVADQEAQKSEDRRGFASRDAFEFVGKCLASGMFPSYTEAVTTAFALTDDLVRYRSTGSLSQPAEAPSEPEPAAATPVVPFDTPPAA